MFLLAQLTYAQDNTDSGSGKRVELDYELDAYYTSTSLTYTFTKKPVPYADHTMSESALYNHLLSASLVPRYALLEVSINPVGDLAAAYRYGSPRSYDRMYFSQSVHPLQLLTSGHEDPYALSLFLGNVMRFGERGDNYKSTNRSYVGYLFSGGLHHLRNNEIIDDPWGEFEWKIKGERAYDDEKTSWSFRIGTKWHANPDIADIYYVSLRRDRILKTALKGSIIDNTGAEYTYALSARTGGFISHKVRFTRFFADPDWEYTPSLTLGFLWQGANRYTGALATADLPEFQVLVQPNVTF